MVGHKELEENRREGGLFYLVKNAKVDESKVSYQKP